MPPLPLWNTRKVFGIWAGALAIVLVLSLVANLFVVRYVDAMRERDPRRYLQQATSLMQQNDFPGALHQLDEAVLRAPDLPDPFALRGRIYLQLDNLDSAVRAFQDAIERDSKDEDMRLKAVSVLLQLKRYREAIDLGKQCMDDGFTYRTFPRYVAEGYRSLGNIRSAIPYYEKALEGYPRDLFLMERLAQGYSATGNQKAASAMEKRIHELETVYGQLK